jgi:hypothetical protein
LLRMAHQEHQILIAQVSEQTKVSAATKLESQREMDELKLQASVLEGKYIATADLLLGAHEQMETAIEEEIVAHKVSRADIVANAI